MKRRDFLKSTAAVTGGGLFSRLGSLDAQGADNPPVRGSAPNILLILVDELRYPTAFPQGVTEPGQFLKMFMPNVYKKLWSKGVKFGNYHTAANACTPARGTMITGLYSQQNWLISTLLSSPYPTPTTQPQPVLNKNYPTYGRLLRSAGYQTPYVGKWHVSVPSSDPGTLEDYGFDYMTYFDPAGSNLQGTYGDENRGYHSDAYSASQAVSWLQNSRPADQPWCLTVSLVNPHDREFFPAGTEFQTVTDLFADSNVNPQGLHQFVQYPGNGPVVDWDTNALKTPPPAGFPTVPPNWQNAEEIRAKDLPTQTFFREFQQGVWGGVTDDPNQTEPSIVHYPNPGPNQEHHLGVVKMPYNYWQRGLDSYAQIMGVVDAQIETVLSQLDDLPASVRDNTVVVFAADHGEYAGAHGFVQGKMGSVYEEVWHIPLIVYDPSSRFTGDIDEIRMGLASSVDLMPMLVSIGNRGTRNWMTPTLRKMYGQRLDMISMLQSSNAPGRHYVLFEFDEIVPNYFNFNRAATHVLGVRTQDTKLGAYMKWVPFTSHIIQDSVGLEFYDLTTPDGMLEMTNTASSDPRAAAGYHALVNHIIPNELQQLLPPPYLGPQLAAKLVHLAYREAIALQPAPTWANGGLTTMLGYGGDF